MNKVQSPAPASPVLAKGFARYRCPFVGWISGWSFFTFVSALLLVVQTVGLGGGKALGSEVWHVADAIPPYAKISFGLLFGALVWLAGRTGNKLATKPLVHGPAAGVVAATTVIFLAPFDYFSGPEAAAVVQGPAGLAHVGVGLLAGLAYAMTRRHCARRAVARS